MRGRMGIVRVLAAAAVAAGLLTGVGATPASASQAHPLRNHNSGKCLEIADWRMDPGAPARQWDCTGGDNQMWLAVPDSHGTRFVNLHSGQCLEIADWRTDPGAPARQWYCTGGANQAWQYMELGPGTPSDPNVAEYLLNWNSGKFLEIADWRTDSGAPARQWPAGARQANMEWDYCYPWVSCSW
ncbi:RICIN domain-containing protein [Kitasatospora sp. NPDC048296]|uniref:RICIN domain-containing protein n=1 Tax=Kitasatospora sp. NPDC048296 TaxID=3364048 RepID=UPI0037129394